MDLTLLLESLRSPREDSLLPPALLRYEEGEGDEWRRVFPEGDGCLLGADDDDEVFFARRDRTQLPGLSLEVPPALSPVRGDSRLTGLTTGSTGLSLAPDARMDGFSRRLWEIELPALGGRMVLEAALPALTGRRGGFF